jgi:hypothetical protein
MLRFAAARRDHAPNSRGSLRTAPSPRDYILFLMLLFLIGFVATRYDDYNQCSTPMAAWLLVAYTSIIVYRVMIFAINRSLSEQNPDGGSWFEQNLPKALVFVHLYGVWLFLLCWSVTGCVFFNESSDCLPASMGSWGFVCSIILVLIYVLQYFAEILRVIRWEVRMRRTIDRSVPQGEVRTMKYLPKILCKLHECMLQRIELDALGAEVLAAAERAREQGHPVLLGMQPHPRPPVAPHMGLSAAQVAEIPTRLLLPDERVTQLCSICLVEFPLLAPSETTAKSIMTDDGDLKKSSSAVYEMETSRNGAHPSRIYSNDAITIRELPCQHVFHIECIDAWLQEKRQCANCRLNIGPEVVPQPQPQQPYHPQHQVAVPAGEAVEWFLQYQNIQQQQMAFAQFNQQQQDQRAAAEQQHRSSVAAASSSPAPDHVVRIHAEGSSSPLAGPRS